ncbi:MULTISPECIES: glycosyltransferase family 2 protein [unclassified Endozoicomonas]|uniref:glycosyltransferase family 2 protein n=1 Tax=unclassified Endozoicomonas TaxID=2644528 RepID=UPI003BB4DE71
MDLSIIIPAYNAEKYLAATLRSLTYSAEQLRNTLTYEIVVINDGSTDATEQIINHDFSDEIKTGLLKYYSQKNQGVSVARNYGLEVAVGRYITFVDADDLVTKEYLPTISSLLNNKDIDIFEFGYFRFKEDVDNRVEKGYVSLCFGMKEQNIAFEECLIRFKWFSWCRVIRAELAKSIQFPIGIKLLEDCIFLIKVYQKGKKIYSSDSVVYAYRDEKNSAVNNARIEQCYPAIEFLRKISLPKRLQRYLDIHIFYLLHSSAKKTMSFSEYLILRIKSNKLSAIKLIFSKEISRQAIITSLFPLMKFLVYKIRNR